MELQEILREIKESKEIITNEFIEFLEDNDKTIQEATEDDICAYITSLYYDTLDIVDDIKDIDEVEQAIANELNKIINNKGE